MEQTPAATPVSPTIASPSGETLVVVDTYSLLFQVFHALPPMTNPDGLPTNALFGIARDLVALRGKDTVVHWQALARAGA